MAKTLVERFLEQYNTADIILPIHQRIMGKTTADIDHMINEPEGNTSDEIIKNVADEAADALNKKAQQDASILQNADQIITQVVYDKMTQPENEKFQKAMIDAALSK